MKNIVRKILPNRVVKIIRKILPNQVLGVLSKIKFLIVRIIFTIQFQFLKLLRPSVGTEQWLVLKELQYGGIVKDIPRDVVSENDPRTPEELIKGGMTGGDRMSRLFHGYADIYAKYMAPYVEGEAPVVLVEVGILQGTGVAIWSDLFKKRGRIIGLDIDLKNIKNNISNLKSKGAFKYNNLELYEFDQYKNNEEYVSTILKGDKINICIDDGVHYDEAILNTLSDIYPYLSENFVYFIEDNKSVYQEIKKRFPDLQVNNYDEMTVITNK